MVTPNIYVNSHFDENEISLSVGICEIFTYRNFALKQKTKLLYYMWESRKEIDHDFGVKKGLPFDQIFLVSSYATFRRARILDKALSSSEASWPITCRFLKSLV